MKVTGYMLREAIKRQGLRKETAHREFSGSLKAFPDETKENPDAIMAKYLEAERAEAILQTAQMRYNLAVTVSVNGTPMPLATAIKLIGGVARGEKLWRLATGPKNDRYGYDRYEDKRSADDIVAKPTVSVSHAVARTNEAAKMSGALREAIATANAREVEVEDLEASLFE